MAILKGRKGLYNMIFLSVLLLSQFNFGLNVKISPIYELAQTDSTAEVKNVLKSLFPSSKQETTEKHQKHRIKLEDPKAIDELDMEKLFDDNEYSLISKKTSKADEEKPSFLKENKPYSKLSKNTDSTLEFKRD